MFDLKTIVPGGEPMELVLPYPPTVNTYWRCAGRQMLLSRRGRSYRRAVEAVVLAGCQSLLGRLPLESRLAVRLAVAAPDGRKRDLDNVLKAVLDALEHAGLYRDDGQIDRLEVCRAGIRPPGHVEIRIEPMVQG
jgi:crossover junction endodeoxyribonuclease RusA